MLRPLFFLRAILVDLLIVFVTAFWGTVAILGSLFNHAPKFGNWVISRWSNCLLKMAGVRVQVEGLENLPSGGAIYLFNHTSDFDIPVVHKAIPKTLRFGAKIELFRVPVFGKAMKALGVLPIIRHKREEVLEIYRQSIENVKNGYGYVLAPEGGRQSGEAIAPFKAGPFIFAIDGQLDMVPVVIFGAHKVMSRNSFLPNTDRWSRTVKVKVLPVISVKGYTLEQRSDLQEKVRQIMVQAYNESGASL